MTDVPIRGPASAPLDAARSWARQRRAARLGEVDAYLGELWRLGGRHGYDPAILAAQSSLATAGWTAPLWRERLNPVDLGVSETGDHGIGYRSGVEAAQAHLVHLAAHVRGADRRLLPYVALDPTWQEVFAAGHAGRAKTLGDLSDAWAGDPGYAGRVRDHLRGVRGAISAPEATPQPAPGRAPLPAGIARLPTGNWRERTFGQQPAAIVFHVSGDDCRDRVLAWFQNPASQASAHALVDRDGTIHQLVSSTRAAWANDDILNSRRDVPWLRAAVEQHWSRGGPMCLDDFTLALELVGTAEEPPTEAQYRGAIALAAYWRDRYAIPPHRGRLLRHSDLNPVDRAHCPGPRFDLTRLILALGGDPANLTT